MDNQEVMERFGFRICSRCNADMPADGFVEGRCRYCAEDVICVYPAEKSEYDRIRRGIDEHDAWKRSRQ